MTDPRSRDPLGAHLKHLAVQNMRDRTITSRRDQLRRFARTLDIDTDSTLLCVTPEDLEGWQQSMVGLSARYRQTATAHVRSFYRWAARVELIDRDPSVRMTSVRVPASLPRPIGEDDLSMAIDCAPDRLRPMLVLAAYAGLRAMEIAGLMRDQVHDHADPPVLHITGKGGRERIVPMSERVVLELRAHSLPSRGFVFPRHDGSGGQNSPARISHLLNEYLHDMGVPDTLHALRHRFGSQMYQASRDLRVTQELMGHASPTTTAGYVAWSSVAAVIAVEALPGARVEEPSNGCMRTG